MEPEGNQKLVSTQHKVKKHGTHLKNGKSSSNLEHINKNGTRIKAICGSKNERSGFGKNVPTVPMLQNKNDYNTEHIVDLSSPHLCSALQLANEINARSDRICENINLCGQSGLKKTFTQKAMKKANVPFTQHIFKDLVDLQFNDEDVIPGKSVHLKNVHFGKNKDRVFELSDYYKSDFSLECYAKIPHQPVESEKIQYYKGADIYERIKSIPDLI